MKLHVEIDCTPEEARRFLGLPDLAKAQTAYSDAMTKAMQGAGSPDQLNEFARQMAPIGQVGLKLFEQFLDGAVSAGKGSKKPGT